MATSLALRRLSSGILLRPRGSTLLAATRPSFITSSNGALLSRRHYSTPYPFSVVRGLVDTVDGISEIEFKGSQFLAYVKPCGEGGTTGEIKEDRAAVQLRADLPGLSKDDVVVYIHQNELHILAEEGRVKKTMEHMKNNNSDKEEEEETTSKAEAQEKPTSTGYFGGILLTPKSYKPEEVKAEMTNCQLHITVPKLTIEEREDLIYIPVV